MPLPHKIVAAFRDDPVYIRVTDIANLEEVEESEWTAIVLIHTWENWNPPVAIEVFVKRVGDLDKVVVLTTSGQGEAHMEEVDALTSASVMTFMPQDADAIIKQVQVLLTKTDSRISSQH